MYSDGCRYGLLAVPARVLRAPDRVLGRHGEGRVVLHQRAPPRPRHQHQLQDGAHPAARGLPGQG